MFFFFSIFVFFFERARPAASMRPPFASFTYLLLMNQGRESEATEAVFCLWAKKPLHTGVRTGCHYLISLSVCVSVAGRYGLTRVTFHRMPSRVGRGRRAAVDFVVFWVGRIFFSVFFFPCFFSILFFFERTRPAGNMMSPCLIYLSTTTGVRTGCHYLISLFFCVSVCVTFVIFTDCESCTRPIFTNPGSLGAGEYGLTRGVRFVAICYRGGSGRWADVGFVVCFRCGGIFFFFFRFCFSLRTHTTCCKYEDTSPHLPLC